MIKLAVAGSPISHSLSPLLHTTAYELLGVQATFSTKELTDLDFGEFYFKAKASGYRGLALTMPLKEISIGFVDRVDPVAKQISSINTIIFESTGSIGLSTDLMAFKSLLKPYFGKRIGILGAGGTARAAIGALKGTGSEVTVLTRSMTRHDQLHAAAVDLELSFLDWHNFEEIQDRDLIISTTPAGATDGLSVISSKADFFEVIYHPWPTELAKRYQNLGKSVIGGLSLLVEQALFQIKYFSQKDFDFDQMRQTLLKVGYESIRK
ncbi:MAG: shikimate dehydrogenase [Actinobacteria bacterium]|jgi:shikimate dehydrogenase|nr:shikimate dehydrogenase [Actinomycetota bacterium]NDG24671.1 shikimate dehydrogenase [Actinomycetota bacterium]